MADTYLAPRISLIGGGAIKDLPGVLRRLGLSRPLIVTDPFLAGSPLFGRCTDPLVRAGIGFEVFSETVSDPTDVVVSAGTERLRGGHFDCMIGFGGGSPIDTAKAIALMALGEAEHIRAYKVPAVTDRAALPVIAIPTTAGTGSEATRVTVITDTEHDEKMLIGGLGCLPLAAIVDHELTWSLPPRITADTGIDSLTHALEAYVSRRAFPVSDMLALRAMELIGGSLRRAYAAPDDQHARSDMMLGAHLAGLAFSNASVALVHGMSRPIGAHFHVPHGLSNAMLLPAVTRFSIPAATARYATAARRIGFAAPDADDDTACAALADGLDHLNRELAVPTPRGFGIDPAAWDAAVETMAQQALASGSPANNPRIPNAADIRMLYNAVWATNT